MQDNLLLNGSLTVEAWLNEEKWSECSWYNWKCVEYITTVIKVDGTHYYIKYLSDHWRFIVIINYRLNKKKKLGRICKAKELFDLQMLLLILVLISIKK